MTTTEPARPADVDRYLLRGERLVAAVHWHVVRLLRPTAVMLGLLALMGWVGGGLPPRSVLGPVLPFLALAVVLWWGWQVLTWRQDRLVVTDRRMLLISGLLTRRVAVMPLRKVTDLTYERPLTGRLLGAAGWGTFVLESAGQDQAFHRIPLVPHPDDLYRRLTDEIFGENGLYPRKPPPGADE